MLKLIYIIKKGEFMIKLKKSGPALFMYSVIVITLIISITCFYLHYANLNDSSIILWTGITAFTIMYHFWVRIIMGNVSKLFRKYHYQQFYFRYLRENFGFSL